MHQYLVDTKYAVENLFNLATTEENKLKLLQADYSDFVKERDEAVGIYMHEVTDFTPDYFAQKLFFEANGMHEIVKVVGTQIEQLQQSIRAKDQAVRSLYQAILQIAKQGLSVAYGTLSNCPPGRNIHGVPLTTVIWQARNQSIHYEDNTFHPPVVECFSRLEGSAGERFSLSKNPITNLSKEVCLLLGWDDYSGYELDMTALLG